MATLHANSVVLINGRCHSFVLNPTKPMRQRLIVVPIIRDVEGRVLLCHMPPDRGAFTRQWGLPGGGVEAGERIEEALRREIREETGMAMASCRPLFFKDDVLEKLYPDGRREL